jgi:putative NADH-flavin reductase
VISAYGPGPDKPDLLVDATRSLIDGVKRAGVRKLLMVGGAGTLEVAPGVELVDSGHLPGQWRGIALAHREAKLLLADSGLEWTSFSPAGFIEPGERTGKFRLGGDQLIVDAKGESRISAEDYAIAMVDELEHPHHANQRFTAGY